MALSTKNGYIAALRHLKGKRRSSRENSRENDGGGNEMGLEGQQNHQHPKEPGSNPFDHQKPHLQPANRKSPDWTRMDSQSEPLHIHATAMALAWRICREGGRW